MAGQTDPSGQRIVFAGTPDFAVPALEALVAAGYTVPAAYTQPDRPAGRGRKLRPSPVRRAAEAAGIPVRTPESLKDAGTQAELAELAPHLMVVVAYGLILPSAVLAIPAHGCINIHASLLPRWRGAAPIHRALLAGDAETGVSIMKMDEGLDTGPVLAERRVPIAPEATAGDLHDTLATLGAETLVAVLPDYLAGRLEPEPQAEDGVTYARRLEKSESRLDFRRPAAELARRVRGLQPWPVADCESPMGTLRIWAAQALAGGGEAEPGTVVAEGPDGIDVACGEGILRITELQRAGKKPMTAADFLKGVGSMQGTLT